MYALQHELVSAAIVSHKHNGTRRGNSRLAPGWRLAGFLASLHLTCMYIFLLFRIQIYCFPLRRLPPNRRSYLARGRKSGSRAQEWLALTIGLW